MIKLQIRDLAEQRFKAPCCARFPTDQLDKDGNTQYANAHFVGVFRSLPVETAREQLRELQEAQANGDAMRAIEMASEQMEAYFIGFEPHPKHDFPFMDGDNPLASSPEAIKQLLNVKEIRDAVQKAWNDARSGEVLTKNSRK